MPSFDFSSEAKAETRKSTVDALSAARAELSKLGTVRSRAVTVRSRIKGEIWVRERREARERASPVARSLPA